MPTNIHVHLSWIRIRYVSVYMHKIINTYDSNSLEFDWNYLMFEFVLSIRVSFVLVGAGRMPHRCAVTLPPFMDKTFPCSVFSFVVEEAAVWRMGSKWRILVWAHYNQMCHSKKCPMDSSGLVLQIECSFVRRRMWSFPAFDSTEIHRWCWNRRRVWRFRWLGAVIFITLIRVCLHYRHCCQYIEGNGWQDEVIVTGWHNWFLNPFGIVGSLESDSIVTICASGKTTEEIVMASRASAPDSCVELRNAGVLFWVGLFSSDERST